MAPKRHNSYTASFKLEAIAKAEKVGNRGAARELGVDERCIRRWRSEKSVLINMPKTKRSRRSGTAHWPELEEVLEKWFLEQREKGFSVSTVKIRLQARKIAANLGISNFNGNSNWCFRFMARKNLSVRTRTTVGQSLPSDWEEKKVSFLNFLAKLIEEKKFNHAQIINMDEVPLTFDCPSNRTVSKSGEKSISIITTGNEKTSFTCVLACTANGDKLKPMIIFKRKTLPKGNFPPDVLIRCNIKGWMCEQLMLEWLKEVWRKRKGAFFQPNGLLIMDSMKAHLMDSVKIEAKKVFASLAIIPGGLTKILQPLDLTINKSFKSQVRLHWENWMAADQHLYTKGGNMKKASYEEVAKWVSEAWKTVSPDVVKSGFARAEIIPEIEENFDDGQSDNENNIEFDEDVLQYFQSDSEESNFDGFE